MCPRCQTQNADTAAFCLHCGQQLTPPTQSIAPGQPLTPPAVGANTPGAPGTYSAIPMSGQQGQQSPYPTAPTDPMTPITPMEQPYPATSMQPTYPAQPTYPTDPASQGYDWSSQPSRRRVTNNRGPFASTMIGVLIGILLVVVLATLIVVGANKGLLSGPLSVFGLGANPTVTTGATGATGLSAAPTVSPTNTARPASTIIYQSTLLTPAAEWEPDQNCFFARRLPHQAEPGLSVSGQGAKRC